VKAVDLQHAQQQQYIAVYNSYLCSTLQYNFYTHIN